VNDIQRSPRATLTWLLVIVLAAAAVLPACAPGKRGLVPPGTTEPDKFLFDRGTENLERKRWIVSRDNLDANGDVGVVAGCVGG